ncbi:MAG: hypothetical protein HYV63_31310 [Candidatus Schekmanbacteria bacterium]|nr:hypothetical protein [Candidatus Schekmanbacteria bacterium]
MSGRILRGDQANIKPASRDRLSSQPAGPLTKGVIDSEVYNALTEARGIIEEAEREKAAILSEAQNELTQAKADAEAIRKQAESDGEAQRKAGFEAGREEGLAQVTDLMLAAREEREKFLKEAEGDILELSMGVARKIIGYAIQLEQAVIVDIVSQAIQTVRHQKELVVRVHPEDLAALETSRPRLMGLLTRARDLVIRGDEAITRGGCMIDSEIGTIDARLSTQLDVLKKVLMRRHA